MPDSIGFKNSVRLLGRIFWLIMNSTWQPLISYICAAYRPGIYWGHPWTPVSFWSNDWLRSTVSLRHGTLPICHQHKWICMGIISTHWWAVPLTLSKFWHLLCRKCIPNAKGNPKYGSKMKHRTISVRRVLGRWVPFYQHLCWTQVPRLYKYSPHLVQ